MDATIDECLLEELVTRFPEVPVYIVKQIMVQVKYHQMMVCFYFELCLLLVGFFPDHKVCENTFTMVKLHTGVFHNNIEKV